MLSALNGFRDVKASLASGALILVAVWLVFSGSLAAEGGPGSLWFDIRNVVKFIGIPATLAALTFLAYLIGVVFAFDSILFKLLDYGEKGLKTVSALSRERLHDRLNSEIREVSERLNTTLEQMCNAAGLVEPVSEAEKTELFKKFGLDSTIQDFWAGPESEVYRDRIVMYLEDQVENNLDLLPTYMHGSNATSTDRYEKASSEAAFRGALVFPLFVVAFALALRLAIEGMPIYAIIALATSVIAGWMLTVRAAEKRSEAFEELVNAISIGTIAPPGLSAIKQTLVSTTTKTENEPTNRPGG